MPRWNRPARFVLWCTALAFAVGAGCRKPADATLTPRPDLTARPAALVAAITAAEAASRSSPEARLDLGRIYHANGFTEAAGGCYAPLISHPLLGAHARYYLADLALTAADSEQSINLLSDVAVRAPEYFPAQLRLAELHYKTGDTTRAVALYDAILQRDPTNAEALIARARERLRLGDDPGAASALEKLLAAHPDHSAGCAMLAQIVEQRGDTMRATLLRDRARLRKDPPRVDPWMEQVALHSYDALEVAMRLEDFVKAGRIDESMTWLRRLETLEPNHPAVREIRGLAFAQQGRHADAAREYERAIAAGVDPARMYPTLVATLIAQQRFAEAETKARAGLAAAPRTPGLLVALAQLEQRKGDLSAATRLLDDALAIEPRHPAANRARALVWWQHGQPEKAVPLLQIVLETAPSEIGAAGMLGQYFLDQGRPADACRPLEQAHTVDPKNEDISELLGLAWLRVGNEDARARRFDPALAAYDRALSVRPNLAEAYVNKTHVCLHLGQRGAADDALRELARVQPANPKLPELRAALARLPSASR